MYFTWSKNEDFVIIFCLGLFGMLGPNCFKKVFQTQDKGYILAPTKKGARVTLCSSIFLREISGALQLDSNWSQRILKAIRLHTLGSEIF